MLSGTIFPRCDQGKTINAWTINASQNEGQIGADPEGGFGDLSPFNFLEVKIIKNV